MSASESIATPVRPTSPTRARVVGVVARAASAGRTRSRARSARARAGSGSARSTPPPRRSRRTGGSSTAGRGTCPGTGRACTGRLAGRLERRRRVVRRVDRLHLDPGLGFAPVGGRHGESMLARVRVLACVLLALACSSSARGGAAREPARAAHGTLDVRRGPARCTPSSLATLRRPRRRARRLRSHSGRRRHGPSGATREARSAIWRARRGSSSRTSENGPVDRRSSSSGDGRWLFFAIDPYGVSSIAADGLDLLVVSTHGGTGARPRR